MNLAGTPPHSSPSPICVLLSHYCPSSHHCVVEYCCAHAHQCTVLHFASVQGDRVSDGHVVAQDAGCRTVESVYATVVLHVGAVAYLDEVHIATQYGVEPHRAVVTHLHVSHYHCSLAEVAMLAESWCGHARQFLDDSHFLVVCLYHIMCSLVASTSHSRSSPSSSGASSLRTCAW